MHNALNKFASATIEAERAFLACVLLDAGTCADAMAGINPSDFLDPVLGRLYGLVSRLAEMGRPVSNSQFLLGELAGSNILSELGGPVAFAELINSLANAAHAIFYADQVKKFSRYRQFQKIAFGILESINHDDTDFSIVADNAIRDVATAMYSITERRDCSAGEAAIASIDAMERLMQNEQTDGVVTGIRCIDALAGAMRPGELIILAARPSIGKTCLAMNILHHAATFGQRGLFISCEMDRCSIGDRLLAHDTAVNCERIARALLTDDQAARLREAAEKLKELPYRIVEASAPTVQQIGAWAKGHAARYGLALLVVDHIGLLRATGKGRTAYETATEIAKELKAMATNLRLPILALCQLNRDGEGEIPRLSMLRDSGAIEECADKVWFLHRERGEAASEFTIAKFRNGAVGKVESGSFVFDADRCSFRDATRSMQHDFEAWSG